jgi:3-hydroxyacyl-[acyl-carrier protein] dehydratase/trans-2-decenoyl-[acyl-carrier protein] isomerase
MGIADGTVAVDGTVIYSAKELRVGLFQAGTELPD